MNDHLQEIWGTSKTIFWNGTMLNMKAVPQQTSGKIYPIGRSGTVCLVNGCEYCSLSHESMGLMHGAWQKELRNETKKVVELFSSFNAIADSLGIPCDIMASAPK